MWKMVANTQKNLFGALALLFTHMILLVILNKQTNSYCISCIDKKND